MQQMWTVLEHDGRDHLVVQVPRAIIIVATTLLIGVGLTALGYLFHRCRPSELCQCCRGRSRQFKSDDDTLSPEPVQHNQEERSVAFAPSPSSALLPDPAAAEPPTRTLEEIQQAEAPWPLQLILQ